MESTIYSILITSVIISTTSIKKVQIVISSMKDSIYWFRSIMLIVKKCRLLINRPVIFILNSLLAMIN
jgi:hypothetical protein